jgi:hypothetical protein
MYKINQLIEDKKDVMLYNGEIVYLTFTPMIVNRLYTEMMDEQQKISDIYNKYNKEINRLQNAESNDDLEKTTQYINDADKIKEEIQQLRKSIEEKQRQIIKIVLEYNNEGEFGDEWFEQRASEEIRLLFQIIFGTVKDDTKKKSNSSKKPSKTGK